MRRTPLLTAAVLVALTLPAAAQQGAAEIRGRVLDAQQGLLPRATVVLRNQETGMFRQVVSSADGTYFLSGVTPGVYELSAELAGFKRYSRRGVRLEVGKTATLDIGLEVGGLDEQITVTAETPLVDVTSKEVGGNITSGELTDLPSLNRSFIGFVALLPGMVPVTGAGSSAEDSVVANGQDPRNNNFMLDGGNNNDDISGQWAGPQARIPIEAVQEFQVLTSQFDAEFSRTTGAIVNAITKQGTNAWHGSAFAFLQDVVPDPEGLLRHPGQPAQARHQLPAVRVHPGRTRRQEQGPLLRQRGAPGRRRSAHHQHPGAARPHHGHHHARPGLEHARPLRPPDQRRPHLERALAAGARAGVEPVPRLV